NASTNRSRMLSTDGAEAPDCAAASPENARKASVARICFMTIEGKGVRFIFPEACASVQRKTDLTPWPPGRPLRDCENRLGLRLRLSTGRHRRDITGNAALPGFDLPAVLELDRLAHDRLPAIGQGGEVLPHGCKGHARFPGDLQVQALSVL